MNHKEFSSKGGKSKSAKKSIAANKNWEKARIALEAKRALSETSYPK